MDTRYFASDSDYEGMAMAAGKELADTAPISLSGDSPSKSGLELLDQSMQYLLIQIFLN